MAIVNYKPVTPGRRLMSGDDFSDITAKEPYKKLVVGMHRKGGRNNRGKMTAKHRGGGHRKLYRLIDYRREKIGIPGVVRTIEYDPNRSARISLVSYADGEKRYVLAPEGVKVGATILSSRHADIKPGNCLPLSAIPQGSMIHNIELMPGGGGKLVRSAGTVAQLLAKEGGYAHIKLPSGEVRMVSLQCKATIGQVSASLHNSVRIGKAGRKRWKGWRPRVRPVAMNPVDHPMGGGEGRSKGGRHPCSEKGMPAKGFKTRKNKRTSKFIIKRRGK